MKRSMKILFIAVFIGFILLSTTVVATSKAKPIRTFTTTMTQKQIEDIVNYYTEQANSEKYIELQFDCNNGIVPAKIFETAKKNNQGVKITCNTHNNDYEINWTFEAKDIINTTIDLKTGIECKESLDTVQTNGLSVGCCLEFAHDGKLPGKASMNLLLPYYGPAYNGRNYEGILYHYNETTKTLVYETEISVGPYTVPWLQPTGGEYRFEIEHCSKYVAAVNTDTKTYKLGDINKDTKIDTKDARLALLAYVGKEKLTIEQRALADVNKDGKVDTKDARQILLYYVGKIKKF